MRTNSLSAAAAAAFLAFGGIAFAEDASMPGHGAAGMELPEACRTGEAPAMPGMENMPSMMEGVSGHRQEMMEGMMQTQRPMMQGMMAEDADIAFACAMIPHHQAAINMAEAELRHGDAEPMKKIAERIIDAQRQEIAELTQWIEAQAQ
jgi:uncharacterized protein (DUF305 family)